MCEHTRIKYHYAFFRRGNGTFPHFGTSYMLTRLTFPFIVHSFATAHNLSKKKKIRDIAFLVIFAAQRPLELETINIYSVYTVYGDYYRIIRSYTLNTSEKEREKKHNVRRGGKSAERMISN